MPALPNSKHELFAQALADGKTAQEAIAVSGLEPGNWRKSRGFYVYALIDPRDGMVFYVGKGKGYRCLAHEKEFRDLRIVNAGKHTRIGEIIADGLEIKILCVADSLHEGMALWIERRLIALVGREILTNAVCGQTTPEQRALIEVSDMRRRIKPFVQWLKDDDRSTQQIIWYRETSEQIRSLEAELTARVIASHSASPNI